MIKSITNVLIIFFIFQQLKSQISKINQNGYNPFCDETLHLFLAKISADFLGVANIACYAETYGAVVSYVLEIYKMFRLWFLGGWAFNFIASSLLRKIIALI